MSSRIRSDDNGPGSQPAPVEDRQRSAPEPQERENLETASDSPEPEEATQRRSDEPANDAEPVGANDGEPQGANDDERTKQQQRIDRLTRERYEARRERDEARAMMAQWQREQQQRSQTNPNDPYEQGRAQGRQEAQQGRAEEAFNAACNDLWQKGVDEYGTEMSDAKRGLDAVGWGNRPDALAALTQLPDGHRVYRKLGGDLDNAARILSLPPMAMAMELARLSGGDVRGDIRDDIGGDSNGANREQSRAPAPLRPVGGNSGRSEKPLDKVSMAEFIRRRDREERGSRIRR